VATGGPGAPVPTREYDPLRGIEYPQNVDSAGFADGD